VDEGLEREHWRRLVPLLHRRSLFAGAREFLLYDCRDGSGNVNEDVFAYSNRDHTGSALVLYHNRYATARGTIRWSAAYAEKRGDGSRGLRQRTLLEGLGFAHAPDDALLRCRDQVSGHESLHRVRELREHGLRVELAGFGSRVLLDWREVARDGRPWDELASALPPEGVPDLERALWAIAVRPAQHLVETVLMGRNGDPFVAPEPWLEAFDAIVAEAGRRLSWPAARANEARTRFASRLSRWHAVEGSTRGTGAERAASEAWLLIEACGAAFDMMRASGAPFDMGRASDSPVPSSAALRLFDELWLRDAVARAARSHGAEGEEAWRLAARVRTLLAHPDAAADPRAWRALLADDDARYAAGVPADAAVAAAPAWLGLPARLEAHPARRS
jgi:hypothetical protein